MRYFAKFNIKGERETSIVEHVHFNVDKDGNIKPSIPEGFIEISVEEQSLYATNKYIRGADGKPQKKPLYVPTSEEIQSALTADVQNHMDAKVQERGYDNVLSACSYANSTFPGFQGEGLACIAWRDAVWRACYDILDEVTAGQREIPTAEELIAELPELVWPEV